MKRNDGQFLDNQHVSMIIRTFISLQVLRQVLWSSSSIFVSASTTTSINDHHHCSSLNAFLSQKDEDNYNIIVSSGLIDVADCSNIYVNGSCTKNNNHYYRNNQTITCDKRLKLPAATSTTAATSSSSVPSTSSSDDENGATTTSDTTTTKNTCRIYFAESTIPNAGWGLFSGTKYEYDEEVGISGDAVVPLFNMFGRTLLRKLL